MIVRFQYTQGQGDKQPHGKTRRQFKAVVTVELDFRQEVRQRDADEGTCRKRESRREHTGNRSTESEIKHDRRNRAEQCKQRVSNA